ncbi:MAG: hypothetical protein MUF81_15380 [Verrucomicrobia bacterium]|nr:hypothetical protein [Verrucomicrobiota bacterium]
MPALLFPDDALQEFDLLAKSNVVAKYNRQRVARLALALGRQDRLDPTSPVSLKYRSASAKGRRRDPERASRLAQ